MLSNVKDHVAVITGASSGIGTATAQLLARQGARVVLGARREAKLIELRDAIHSGGGTAEVVVTDMQPRYYSIDNRFSPDGPSAW
jgi:NADP-dependent 3-hydroxy acid dehydrogenase YdfG